MEELLLKALPGRAAPQTFPKPWTQNRRIWEIQTVSKRMCDKFPLPPGEG